MSNIHQPVMLAEVILHLAIKADGIYVDATFGRGGHSRAILDHLGAKGRLIAFDKDLDAVRYAEQTFADDARFSIHHSSYVTLAATLSELGYLGKIAGIIFDLGVSSPQLDNAERGFSFLREGPLDMRMDTSRGSSVASLIAKIDEKALADIFWRYGEERYARRIARAIVAVRKETPITTTLALAHIIKDAHPAWQRGEHPATKCFMALRIWINQELEELEQGLHQAIEALAVGGRLSVISFHSLEDRIVKQFIRQQEKQDEVYAKLPIKAAEIKRRLKRLGAAIKPGQAEIDKNPRARSAILRIAEKLI